MSEPRILVTNSVPLNGGDEALLRATLGALRQRWPAATVRVCCRDREIAHRELPDLPLYNDMEFADGNPVTWPGRLRRKAARRIPRLTSVLPSPERRRVRDLYEDSDVIVSAPGGFLNDFYPLHDRLTAFEMALDLGKPLVLFSQSVGPFWRPESKARIGAVLNAARVCLRDELSAAYLQECGVGRVVVAADAAFLWRSLVPSVTRPAPTGTIAVAFRSWPPGDVDRTRIIDKAAAVCASLLGTRPCRLRFLSTCQGIPGYIDDSLLSRDIVRRLPSHLAARCDIDVDHHSPMDLIDQYATCEAYVGMRLHGAILSMLAGTPACGIGYEDKTEQIFGQLGLADYQTRFENVADEWIAAADRMLTDAVSIGRELPSALDRLAQRAQLSVDAVADALASR